MEGQGWADKGADGQFQAILSANGALPDKIVYIVFWRGQLFKVTRQVIKQYVYRI